MPAAFLILTAVGLGALYAILRWRIAIAYTDRLLAQLELGPGEEVIYWKDRRFIFHVIRLLGVKEVRARVTFGEEMRAGQSRKELSGRVRERLSEEVRARILGMVLEK